MSDLSETLDRAISAAEKMMADMCRQKLIRERKIKPKTPLTVVMDACKIHVQNGNKITAERIIKSIPMKYLILKK